MCCMSKNYSLYAAHLACMQAALFRLDGSNLTQVAPADGEFSDVKSASCNNFVWLRNDTSPAAAAPPITLAASCALNGPGAHTVCLQGLTLFS